MDRRTATRLAAGSVAAAAMVAAAGCGGGGFGQPSSTAGAPAERTTAPSASEPIPGLIARGGPSQGGGSLGANASPFTEGQVGSDFDPSVSPDGRFVVFASTRHRETPDLFLKRVGGSVLTQLTDESSSEVMPAISPDGKRVAFVSDRNGSWDLYVMPVAGGRPVQLTRDSSPDLHPSWSPDGTRIVFCRQGRSSGRWELWVVDADNPSVSRYIGEGLLPKWCPTPGTGVSGADRIVYQRARERDQGAYGVWMMDFAGGEAGSPMHLVSLPDAACINPSWSPDGRHVVYSVVPTDGTTESGQLWMTNVEGSWRVALTGGAWRDHLPVWASDGRVYFVSNRTGTESIWSVDAGRVLASAAESGAPIAQAGSGD
ncbi:MAG TPA: DPP IV N-terminal domain-containing protein [Phycisphaerales bacterium]|nr:DPP IV N-terminal domain-containing protein [Phycisphaerales bacterium]